MGPPGTDSFLPATYDLFWAAVVVAQLVLLGFALYRWFRNRTEPLIAVLHILVILFVPVLGPLVYLLATSPARKPSAPEAATADRQSVSTS